MLRAPRSQQSARALLCEWHGLAQVQVGLGALGVALSRTERLGSGVGVGGVCLGQNTHQVLTGVLCRCVQVVWC